MKSRLSQCFVWLMLLLAPVIAFAQEHSDEAAPEVRRPNPVSMQMLVLPIIIVAVLAYNAFRKRK